MPTIYFRDYHPAADGSENTIPLFEKAIEDCRKEPGTTLVIDPGTYLMTDPQGVADWNAILNYDDKSLSFRDLYRSYRPYASGIRMEYHNGTHIKGDNVTLLCEGIMEPITILNCNNVIIDGLTIRYKRPPFTQGFITDIRSTYFDVELDPRTPLTAPCDHARVSLIDPVRHRFDMTQRQPKLHQQLLHNNTVLRLYDTIPTMYKGFAIVFTHTFHTRPAIHIQKSNSTVIRSVTINSQPGMGIVGNRSINITLDGVRVVPFPGLRLSTNTDATHFTNCKGVITLLNCLFGCPGDDSLNVHSFYSVPSVPRIEDWPHLVALNQGKKPGDPVHILTITTTVITHSLIMDAPEPGDQIEFVDRETLNVVYSNTVQLVIEDHEKMQALVVFNDPIPQDIIDRLDSLSTINVSALPSVVVRGCHICCHRARGILLKTRNVLVENCFIETTTLSAIHIAVERFWDEGPGSQNIIIRNNCFVQCGYEGPCCGIVIDSDCEKPEESLVHKNILIENNLIENDEATPDIIVRNAENVSIVNNHYRKSTAESVFVEYSKNVTIVD